ncbi:MAG: DUF4139 domain-containing protein [Chlamydiae bacterium]|nr:MAG: DUF4139 domain-containing protein [Chlamydiota bacterium]
MKKFALLSLSAILLVSTCNANTSTETKSKGSSISSAASTLADQKKIAVTIYNSGFGVIRDEREMTLPTGIVDLKFMEVASQIQPETVQIDPITAGNKLTVLEQNYEYDLMSPAKLMEKYVGKKVTLIQRNDFKGSRINVSATLISYNNRQPIYKIGNKIVINRGMEEVELPTIPENLVSEPTLIWKLDNLFPKKQEIVANYMTRGMRWNADYVAVLSANDKKCGLNGWVTIDNNCGATFKNAQLKLVAGDVQRVMQAGGGPMSNMMTMDYSRKSKKSFKEESLFEYHMYTLDRPTTLKQNQKKQISLLEAHGIDITKIYRCIGQNYFYRNRRGDMIKNIKIGVFISFMNSKTNNLGIPLPKGTVRVYKADSSGNNQFVGEDRIDHTPKNEKIEVKLGDAFDIISERRQTSWKKIGDNTYDTGWEIKIRNHKNEDIVVNVVEPFGCDWQILKSSQKYEKKDAFTAVFKVPVKKNSETVLTYNARLKW